MNSRCTGSLLLVAALLAGCSGSSSSSKSDTSAASEAAATSTTVGPAVSAAPTTTAASTTTTAPPVTTTVPPASITPFAVCVDSVNGGGEIERGNDAIYFGYEVSGSQPVVVPPGLDNAVNDALVGDDPNVPTVFAPGRVDIAFLAITSIDGALPSWTVRGPDGVSRTATAEDSTAFCTPELVAPGGADDRTLSVDYSFRTLPEGSDTVDQLEVTATVSGLPELSTCPAGLDPRPLLVELDLGDARTIGTTGRVVLDIESVFRLDLVEVRGVGFRSAVRVTDVCGAGDSVSEAWPVNLDLEDWAAGGAVCVEVNGTTAAQVGCAVLPATGGIRATR